MVHVHDGSIDRPYRRVTTGSRALWSGAGFVSAL